MTGYLGLNFEWFLSRNDVILGKIRSKTQKNGKKPKKNEKKLKKIEKKCRFFNEYIVYCDYTEGS